MNVNELAKLMRDRALLIEADPDLDQSSLRNLNEARLEAQHKKQRVRDMQKLYFDAGRWKGGSKDYEARKAFEEINQRSPWLLKGDQ
jgi:hypothetical protein